jgi:hypothetical protein
MIASLRAFVILLAVLARSGPAAAAAGMQRVPYEGSIRASLEEDFADGKLRVLLTLRAHDLAGCGSLATTVTRAPAAMTIAIAGIDRDPASLMCALMEPPAPSARFDLTNDAGHTTLTVRLGERADSFALDVGPTEVGIAPLGTPAFVELKAQGKMRRVPPNVMWVRLSYRDEAARKRFRPEADALVAALTAAGAKPIKLPAGKYAARYLVFATLDPHPRPSDDDPPPTEDTYFFQYEGTFDALAKIGERWKKYDRRHDKRGAYMSTHITDPHGRRFSTDL